MRHGNPGGILPFLALNAETGIRNNLRSDSELKGIANEKESEPLATGGFFTMRSIARRTRPAERSSRNSGCYRGSACGRAANTDALQKATQNPVASLISVPIQNNSNFGIGPNDRTQNVLNIQPVIPIKVSKDWNLIVRWIMPIIWQPAPGTQNLEVFGIEENTPASLAAQSAIKQVGVFGFGDMQPTFFLSPAKPGKLIWGVGPIFVLPTATSDVLGQGKLSIGPSVVGLVQPGHWTIGALINNVWSVAGSGGRADVNQMLLQYFVNYNLKKGWYLHHVADSHRELAGHEWESVGGAARWRSWAHHEAGIPTGQHHSSVLWQCGASVGRFAVGHALANCVPVSQVNQTAAEDDDGEKTERVGGCA